MTADVRVAGARGATSLQVSAHVGDAWQLIREGGTVGPDVPVCSGGSLVGIVPVERLLAAPADEPIAAVMETSVARA